MKQKILTKVPENKADQRSACVQKSQGDFRHPTEFNDYIEQHRSKADRRSAYVQKSQSDFRHMTKIYILILAIMFIILMILLFKIAI